MNTSALSRRVALALLLALSSFAAGPASTIRIWPMIMSAKIWLKAEVMPPCLA